jgi:MFS family permease
MVLLALTPYLVLSTAGEALTPLVEKDLGLGATGMQLTAGMANAAYAFGAVAGLQLSVRLPVRRLLLVFSSLFVVGSVLAAWAPVPGLHVAGRVVQGLTTGAMLIAAVPPLVIGNPKDKLPYTAAVMNLGIFGATALGPVVGGLAAGTGTWRPFFWIIAGLGLAGFVAALLTYEDQQPQDPDAPVDAVAVGVAAAGCALAFFGAAFVQGRHLLSVPVLLPLLLGVALIAFVLVHEYRSDDPLMPVERLATTLPVAGIAAAMIAGAASVAAVELTQSALAQLKTAPGHIGALFWPELGGALATAILFGRLFFTRATPFLVAGGLLALGAGAVLLTGVSGGGDARVLVGSGLVGLGTGASVSPALFLTGFSLVSDSLPRVFALVELLRGVAAFMVAPLLAHLAMTTSGGVRVAMWVTAGLALGGAVVVTLIYVLGGARPDEPRADEWLAGEEPALESPPVLALVRADQRQAV